MALCADGLNVHAILMSRSDFRQAVEGALQNFFKHSLLAKGLLLYTHDFTIVDLCLRLSTIGDRDMQLQLFTAEMQAFAMILKAHLAG